jgi:hypothetical protein
VVSSCNTDWRSKVCGDIVNFLVTCETDGPGAPPAKHVLKVEDLLTSLGQIQSARHNHWVLVDKPAADQAV